MRHHLLIAAALASAMATSAPAQEPAASPLPGSTRLDLVASGKVSRVPDVALISAGVQTRSSTATGAIEENAARMERVRAALKRAGIAERDIQTSTINLNPDYAYEQNQPPRLTGYNATNMVSVRFRDIRRAGQILDALVREGANSLNGPNLVIDKPEEAYDEAKMKALAEGRARADRYARALGKRVVRLISVSESGAMMPPPRPYAADEMMATASRVAKTQIDPGEQDVEASLSMSFELQ